MCVFEFQETRLPSNGSLAGAATNLLGLYKYYKPYRSTLIKLL
jgi:hypothetical protein